MLQLATWRSRYLDLVWSALSLGLAIDLIAKNAGLDAVALLYLCLHLMTAILFLIRRPPLMHSSVWRSYFVAGLSTIYVYGYDLSSSFESHLAPAGKVLIAAGAVFCLLSLLSLGKCFGVFPICRGLTTAGLYRIMRHPLYASYILMDVGLIVSYPSTRNGLLFLSAIILFIWRIHYEELLLQTLAEYRMYMASAKFRLLPFVY